MTDKAKKVVDSANAQTIKAIMELTGKTQADEVEITESDENDNNK